MTPDRLRESGISADVSFLLARANALSIELANSALAVVGLKVRSYSVLALAAGDAPPTQRELSEILRLDPSQIVALVDELQRRALVERRPHPEDRRANVVVATPEGRSVADGARAATQEAERILHARLSADERDQLAALLGRIAYADRDLR
jgi:DNA-binding MarR family transcriptional regulator